MPVVVEATYKKGLLVLEHLLETKKEGKKFKVILIEQDSLEAKQFFQFINQHRFTLQGDDPFNREEIYEREAMAVEVGIPSSSTENIPISSIEGQFKHKLLELGLLTQIKNPLSKKMGDGEQPLAQVQGKPLSQLIIEERR
jgi:predicted DNA-binding antitoxin AbrB/MazE fold protein